MRCSTNSRFCSWLPSKKTSTHLSPHETQETTSHPSFQSSFGWCVPSAAAKLAATARSNYYKGPQITTPDTCKLGFDLPCTPRHPIPKVAVLHSALLLLPPLDYPALHPCATTMATFSLRAQRVSSPHPTAFLLCSHLSLPLLSPFLHHQMPTHHLQARPCGTDRV